ncbi:hypothetical protein GRX03_11700 [Halovenus sp. WSH3]|uniref:Uncharacterized protein n=1 Tax=Halovenus carboxidivorans TaxID=2692199 RepID=A0A6B0T2H2_9EURY|nr:hypothetical protein [Halovenus carboxidivorans]MXR52264.1 hypothetical protein [Halovenus carboxidivorans]
MTDSSEQSAVEAVEEVDAIGPAVLASVGSVLLALYFYYVRDDKQRGQFIGLWPTTILALASYFKLREIQQALSDQQD